MSISLPSAPLGSVSRSKLPKLCNHPGEAAFLCNEIRSGILCIGMKCDACVHIEKSSDKIVFYIVSDKSKLEQNAQRETYLHVTHYVNGHKEYVSV